MERDYYGEEIVARFGDWYVTETTIVYPAAAYEISRMQAWEIGRWDEHLSEKRWYTPLCRAQFLAACEWFVLEVA